MRGLHWSLESSASQDEPGLEAISRLYQDYQLHLHGSGQGTTTSYEQTNATLIYPHLSHSQGMTSSAKLRNYSSMV